MGCDIHPLVQVRKNGVWETITPWSGNWEDEELWVPESGMAPPQLSDRNYSTFGILANVRNRDWWPIITERRGLPQDLGLERPEPEYVIISSYLNGHSGKANDSRYYIGEHSYTWVSLRELNEYQWTQRTQPDEYFATCPAEAVGSFYDVVLPWMNTLGSPDDVRLVMGFDS